MPRRRLADDEDTVVLIVKARKSLADRLAEKARRDGTSKSEAHRSVLDDNLPPLRDAE